MNGALPRYRATNLDTVLAEQGRKRRWLAAEVGVSESLLSKVLLGQRTLGAEAAERVATILNMPLFLLFELHDRSETESLMEQAA